MGIAIVMSTTMMVMTTMSSTKVKPRSRGISRGCRSPGSREPRLPLLPLGIRCTIGSLLVGLAIHIEDVLAAPTQGFGIVLITAHTPLRSAGERVAWDAPHQVDLLILGSGQLNALDELFQGFRIAVRTLLDRAKRAR